MFLNFAFFTAFTAIVCLLSSQFKFEFEFDSGVTWETLRMHADESVDMVYIDGDLSYKGKV